MQSLQTSKEVSKPTSQLTKLFVYGIFLDKSSRDGYGMSNPHYATVKDYTTLGWGDGYIVQAKYVPGCNLALTGLLVEMNPYRWGPLDKLEAGYDRIIVTTTSGEEAYMYAERNTDEDTSSNNRRR